MNAGPTTSLADPPVTASRRRIHEALLRLEQIKVGVIRVHVSRGMNCCGTELPWMMVLNVHPLTRDRPISNGATVPGEAALTRASVPRIDRPRAADPSLVRRYRSVGYRRSRHWQSVLRHPRYRYPAIIRTMITATATAEDIKITARMCSRIQSWRAFRCRSFNEISSLGG